MARLVFTRNTPRRVFALLSPHSANIDSAENRPALRPQFGSFAAGLCTREGDFWSDRRLGPLARTRGGCISPVDQLPAAVHDPAVNKSENPKPQGDEWPASNTAIPPSTTSAPANCWAKTAMPTSFA